MTPRRPTELAQASRDLDIAWQKYNLFIDADDKVGKQAICLTIDILSERYNILYREWQILGGTSDIESLAHPFVDYNSAEDEDNRRTMEEARL